MKHSVAGIIQKDGLLFIAKRFPTGDMSNRWEFPGGKVDGEESFEQALIREYKEEFGLSVKVGKLLGEVEFIHQNKKIKLHAYEVLFSEFEVPLFLSEHSEYMWASLDTIENLLFVDSDRMLLPGIKLWLQGL